MWNLSKDDNRIAAIDDAGRKLTYSELAELADVLKTNANRKLCFNLCRNHLGSLAGYISMLEAGVVPVMLASDMDRELLHNLITSYEPDYFWCIDEDVDALTEFVDSQNDSQMSINIVVECKDYKLIKSKYNNNQPIFENLALLLTTSGSTGSPKFVRQSYANIKANTDSIIEYLSINDKERPITTLPMNYTYGLSIINTHIRSRATILVTDKTLMDRGFWKFFKDEEATSFGGVPYTYEILDKLRLYRMDLPSLKTMTQAGGKLSVALHEKLANFAADTGRNFVVMYGQTEATARMGYLPADKALEKIGSMGIAIPGGEFHLIDVDGNDITETDVTGELLYKGANVTLGYAESREDLSKGDERDGILVTGDMAMFDEDGYYYIVGRKKRFLKLFGKRVNLDEIDRLIKAQYPDIDVATSGQDDHMKIYLASDELSQDSGKADEACDSVRKYVATKIQINLSAIEVLVIAKIPRSESGKVLYKEL